MGADKSRPKRRIGEKFDQFIDEIMAILAEDFGVVDHTPMTNYMGPDKTVPGSIAMRGRNFFDDYMLSVEADKDDPNAVPCVRASCQIDISMSDLRKRLQETVETKDRPENDVLLITTQLPDKSGYIANGDLFVAQVVEQIARSGLELQPKYLDQVIFHVWHANAMTLYERPEVVPKLVDSSIWPPLITSGALA